MAHAEWTPGVPHHIRELRGTVADEAGAEPIIDVRVSVPMADTCVLHVTGEVDLMTAPTLDSAVARQLASLPCTLILDLTGVEFMSSTGLASLMTAREGAAAAGVRLRLVCSGRAVLRPMVMTGLVDMFDVHPDLRAALSA